MISDEYKRFPHSVYIFIDLFICILYNDYVRSSDYIVSNDSESNESQRMLEEAVVA
jgi:hypothetical protein